MTQTGIAADTAAPRPGRSLPSRLLDALSSVWLGIVLMALIFVYSSLGSAYPPLRQHRLLEKTEMEWFGWWPFQLLIGLLCLNLIVVTVRRIPLRLTKAGVWMIHSGILILCAGSVYYFGTKVEGDTPVFRCRAVIEVPGADPVPMVVRPGSHATASGPDGEYRFEVEGTAPEWPILSGEDKGKTAFAVMVHVQTLSAEFTRQLLAGYPQYTEDILPSGRRARKETGQPLVDEALQITLDYEPQEYLYVADSAALLVRTEGERAWSQRVIDGLPHYHERIASLDRVWVAPGDTPPPIHPLDIELPAPAADDALADVGVRVTGYLRYALERSRWVDGGERLNPVVGVRIDAHGQEPLLSELVAFDPEHAHAADGDVMFQWVESPDEIEALVNRPPPTLTVEIPGTDQFLTVPVTDLATLNPDLPFRPVEGSDYEFRIRNRVDRLTLADGRPISVAIVEIRTPERTFTRMVANDPAMTKDMSEQAGEGHGFVAPDPGIVMRYEPSETPWMTVVAGPDPVPLTVLVDDGEPSPRRLTPTIGRREALNEHATLTVSHLYENGQRETRPEIVPLHRRDRDARVSFSMVQVALSGPGWEQELWLPYNAYALPGPQYQIPGRITYGTRWVTLPDGRRVELMFSRERRTLGARVALEDFELKTRAGGFTGQTTSVRDFVSRVRFETGNGDWSDPVTIATNNPQAHDGLWYFQATWDPPSGESAGMNFTGLGVGNRNGVMIQLAGTALAVAGMIFTFYVKPIIIRRRRLAAVRTGATTSAASPTSPTGGVGDHPDDVHDDQVAVPAAADRVTIGREGWSE